ncbi:hypothetical protein [Xenorhabdus stockiae]|uniref:hypothetical protein n=1 Tax=Xenorhabdus stockiae TaxID=351614 RepID=UPI004063B4B2
MLVFRNGTVSIGDVFCSQYGYEQTNVHFYQVISIHGKKTIVVQEIEQKIIGYTSSMSVYTKPASNCFIGERLKRQIRDSSNNPCIKIDECEFAYKTTPQKIHEFSSWY